jgi:hypothetical protein
MPPTAPTPSAGAGSWPGSSSPVGPDVCARQGSPSPAAR